jgi:hypothetical protein
MGTLWQIFFEGVKSIIAILTEIFFNHPPEECNEGQLTVELGKKDAKMSSCLDNPNAH